MEITHLRRFIKFRFLPTLAFVMLFSGASNAQDDAYDLFKAHCQSCHKISGAGISGATTGPDLTDVHSRVPGKEWMFDWIMNNGKLVAKGDPYAVQISKYDASSMNVFDGVLNEDEINSLIAWLEAPAKGGGPDPGSVECDPMPTPIVEEEANNTIFYTLIALGVLLLVIISFLSSTAKTLKRALGEEKEEEDDGKTIKEAIGAWAGRNKALVALFVVFVLLGVGADAYNALIGIGVYEGYEPTQPIAFNHKLHAGCNEIQCVYCHSGAEKGKMAGIPSANVCMNCHKYIQEGPTTGKTEIQKIYDAIGFDPEKGKYIEGYEEKPIVWNRVHNLPDHAYFNHSQHVVVGEVECQTCHGPVEEQFTVAKQHSPLTMGWCVECHRETEVKMAGNGYYDEIHARLQGRHETAEKITVDMLGGIECAKCHY